MTPMRKTKKKQTITNLVPINEYQTISAHRLESLADQQVPAFLVGMARPPLDQEFQFKRMQGKPQAACQ